MALYGRFGLISGYNFWVFFFFYHYYSFKKWQVTVLIGVGVRRNFTGAERTVYDHTENYWSICFFWLSPFPQQKCSAVAYDFNTNTVI